MTTHSAFITIPNWSFQFHSLKSSSNSSVFQLPLISTSTMEVVKSFGTDLGFLHKNMDSSLHEAVVFQTLLSSLTLSLLKDTDKLPKLTGNDQRFPFAELHGRNKTELEAKDGSDTEDDNEDDEDAEEPDDDAGDEDFSGEGGEDDDDDEEGDPDEDPEANGNQGSDDDDDDDDDENDDDDEQDNDDDEEEEEEDDDDEEEQPPAKKRK